MTHHLKAFIKSEDGAVTVDMVVLMSLIITLSVAVTLTVGNGLQAAGGNISDTLVARNVGTTP